MLKKTLSETKRMEARFIAQEKRKEARLAAEMMKAKKKEAEMLAYVSKSETNPESQEKSRWSIMNLLRL